MYPAAGAPAEDAPVAFDLLSFPPLTNLFAVITRLLWWGFALYTVGIVSGFFTGHPLPRIQVDGCDCALAALRRNLASPPSQVARAKTCGRVMHYWLQRCSGASVGNHIHRGAASPAMNLFCIGLSHHTANVATGSSSRVTPQPNPSRARPVAPKHCC
jgi:hypothetical protein